MGNTTRETENTQGLKYNEQRVVICGYEVEARDRHFIMAQTAERAWKGVRTLQEEKENICRDFTRCLCRAETLIDIVSNQKDTNPTYQDLLDIMAVRVGP